MFPMVLKGDLSLVTLTGFADEISSDLDLQLDVLQSEGIHHFEFRGVWDKNVLKLSNEELGVVKKTLEQRGFGISSIGSPIGKISIVDDFELHLKDFERALEVAHLFNAKYIRIFSFFIPNGSEPSVYREEVMKRMKALVERAEAENIILLHENEKEIYGDTPERCLDIFETCSSANLRAAFDPANFVQCGVRPYSHAFPLLKNHVEYMHIKDALFEGGKVVPSGEGDGEVQAVLSSLKDSGYHGFMSLEPHLSSAGTFSGFSGPDLFRLASHALKSILKDLDVEWD